MIYPALVSRDRFVKADQITVYNGADNRTKQ